MARMKRADGARTEDRWHRPARKGEQVKFPADAAPGDPVWCMDAKHGTPGAQVCTGRHGQGQRWQARWVADGKERSKSFRRKVDSDTHVAQVSSDITTGTYVDTKRSATAFGAVAEEWFTAKRAKLKLSTAAGYRSLLDNTVLPRWRDARLSDITHADIQQWVTWMTTSKDARQPRSNDKEKNDARKPLSARRAEQAYRILDQVLRYAIRTKRLAVNPADDVELPRVVHKPETALSHEQVAELVAAAGEVAPIMLALAYSAFRFGELAALRVRDVDLKRRRFHVSSGVTQVTGIGLVEDTTKTSQQRSVPVMTDELHDVLVTVMAGRRPDEYLFPMPDGRPMPNWYFKWRFEKACKAADLTGISIKTLRHTAGSLALQAGASVVTVQRLLGHKSATTTLRVYSHMLPDDFDTLTAAMNKAVTERAKTPAAEDDGFHPGDEVREYRDHWHGVVLEPDDGNGVTVVAVGEEVKHIATAYLRSAHTFAL
ncbi:hypothetical protein BOH72_01805 [Mycobacterium sp. WY10]|nr:hypothetical protein BOH72_01805 [Mycobacterium sp. WY10]